MRIWISRTFYPLVLPVKKCGKIQIEIIQISKKCGKFKLSKYQKSAGNSNWNSQISKKCGKFKLKFLKYEKKVREIQIEIPRM